MKIIKSKDAILGTNTGICKTIEYSFGDKDLDLGIATLTGRYPEKGYCVNLISKELVYVLEGSGELFCEDEVVKLEQGDAILIEDNRKYYWLTKYCKVAMTCSPAWNPKQYKIIE